MRIWFFHPLIFYPLAIIAAVLLIGLSLQPQKWERQPVPVAAAQAENTLVYRGAAFNSPNPDPVQSMFVVRNFWGAATALRIAVLPGQEAPNANDQGVRVLMTPEDAARIDNRPVVIDITYNPSPVNAATGLAVSLQGGNAAEWITQDTPPEPNTLRFELPAHSAVNAIGLRALSADNDQASGIEITRIRITPRT